MNEMTGKLMVSTDGTEWGRVAHGYNDIDGNDRIYLSFWLSRPNFQSLVFAKDLVEVEEGSYEHRLMILAEDLMLISGSGRPGQFAWLRQLVDDLGEKPRVRDLVDAASAIKQVIGRMRGVVTVAEIRVILAEFVAAERA
jgi:hypothetical protein